MCDPKTISSSAQWITILTPLASFALGFVTAVFAEPVRQYFFSPELELSFSGGDDTKTLTPTIDGREAIYVRVRVENKKPKLARQCRAYLVKIEKKNETDEFVPTNYVDSIQLAWSCQTTGNERRPIDIPNGVSQYLDVVATSSRSNSFELQISPFPIRYKPLVSQEPGTYRYTIQVAGDGVDPKLLRLVFVWQGRWKDIEVYQEKDHA